MAYTYSREDPQQYPPSRSTRGKRDWRRGASCCPAYRAGYSYLFALATPAPLTPSTHPYFSYHLRCCRKSDEGICSRRDDIADYEYDAANRIAVIKKTATAIRPGVPVRLDQRPPDRLGRRQRPELLLLLRRRHGDGRVHRISKQPNVDQKLHLPRRLAPDRDPKRIRR